MALKYASSSGKTPSSAINSWNGQLLPKSELIMLDIKSNSSQQVPFWGQKVELKTRIENSICIELCLALSGILISCVEDNKINSLKYSNNEFQSLETSIGVTLNFSDLKSKLLLKALTIS